MPASLATLLDPSPRRCAQALTLACALLGGLGAQAAEPAPPLPGLLVSYQVAPAQRLALRQALRQVVQTRLKTLKTQGVLADYRVLFSRHADSDQWDGLVVLTFTAAAQQARWAELEREAPAALDPATLASVVQLHSVPVELVRRQHAEAPEPSPVVLAIPYQSLVSAGDYLNYADAYVIPQFQGWMNEGMAAQYAIYASSFPAGRGWSHLILVDYRGDEGLAARNATVAKVRARLKEQPTWHAISESKARVRDEKAAVVADDITVR
ncbi:MAG: hypothetical protein KGN16_22720 [Burkholderiales bacterium]|nr:hypothetical protein [Burkholderiales bacterium]